MSGEQDITQETNSRQSPPRCATGCGFYGNPRNNGMCSVCYKVFLQRQSSSGCAANSATSPSGHSSSIRGETLPAQSCLSTTVTLPAATSSAHEDPGVCSGPSTSAASSRTAECLNASDRAAGSVDETAQTQEKPKVKKNRCFTCHKKVGLTGFDCRCGHLFCSLHRYSDVHNCTFDYKAEGAERLRKENPKITREKIQKL